MEKIYTCRIFRKGQKCGFPQICGRVEGLIHEGKSKILTSERDTIERVTLRNTPLEIA